jgi:hypothetical protein
MFYADNQLANGAYIERVFDFSKCDHTQLHITVSVYLLDRYAATIFITPLLFV